MVRNRGFTLIEILATITIATITITAIFPLFRLGQRGVYKSSDKSYAILTASDLIEVVRGTSFEVLPPKGEGEYYTVQELRNRIHSGDNLRRNLVFNHIFEKKFNIGIFIMPVAKSELHKDVDGVGELRQVVVRISWKSALDDSRDDPIEEDLSMSAIYGEHKSG